MAKNQSKILMHGALLLSVAALIAKVLSAVYRIPLQNIAGNQGFYVYQQVYPIYGIGMTLALSGLPNYISKLVAESTVKDSGRVLAKSFILMVMICSVIFMSLFTQAHAIARLMGDPHLRPLIQVVSFMLVLTPFLACMRGYFQGIFNMRPTAISQVVEQVLRVAVIIMAAVMYRHYHWNLYTMGTVAMSGALVGGLAATLIMVNDVRKNPLPLVWQDWTMNFGHFAKHFLIEGGSISLFAATMVIFQLLDSFSVAKSLIESGISPQQAYNLKGIYDRAQPLVQLGLVITMSFSTTLLPALSDARQQNKPLLFIRTTQQLVHISLALSAAATCGLVVLMPWINQLLFGDRQESLTLAMYMFSIMVVALINVFSSVLQSLNRFRVQTFALLSGFLIKLAFNQLFTRLMGVFGSSFITVVALSWICFIIYFTTPNYVRQAIFENYFIIKLAVITVIMGLLVIIIALISQHLIGTSRFASLVVLLPSIIGGIIIFFSLSIKWQLLTLREWLVLPAVGKWLHHFLQHGGNKYASR